ncbi:hypothetical protein, partial [Pseudoxanthomonas sp. KAs_5_3]|uniref:hypothetical protein n=1 Tax=Pseudoxanthomonas sp. KAs_5_3 TaxID=2067658 RepID=UPI0018EB39BC
MKICVHGAGAWGTAVAVNAAARHEVTLWARDAAQADARTATPEAIALARKAAQRTAVLLKNDKGLLPLA